ncbi:MAG TPA: 16S rRNA (cytidine(1402)-2'-O)-methyltransferase [Verrucomicrobia bacterium]|nr:MAG: 16S rRNA (cytidine(1402)-2'-O)-methyltransferase [Lentisphaerae bacterium GWF2_57_35]HBA82631.1 16S rRNA (cytidine(1402)-2'-O)-methyltransferase [Verrucomicrobiota bacterium]
MEPGLYIVGTPIGNLQDITLRALETLKTVTLILAEDTRQTVKLLERHEIHAQLMSCHKFNELSRVDMIAGHVERGGAVALVTDSGMPAISDPGARVVAACRERKVPIFVIPGPSAVTAAFALSGMGGQGFVFEGFLDHKTAARRRKLTERADELLPLVLYESPYRLLKLMGEIKDTLGDRKVFVGRELTKYYEECLAGTPDEIMAVFAQRTVKGELVVIVEPAAKTKRVKPSIREYENKGTCVDTENDGC